MEHTAMICLMLQPICSALPQPLAGCFLSSLRARKNCFTKGAIGHWDKLPREVVELPSREVFKRHLDEVLSDMV